MSRKSKTKRDPAAEGIYSRGHAYWLRYSIDGIQHRVPLGTRDYAEAVEKAKLLRGRPIAGKTERMVWDSAIERYIDEKIQGKRPAHLRGRRLRTFDPKTTAPKTASVLRQFHVFCGRHSPQSVTREDLQKFYDELRLKSEASARSQVLRVQAFLEHLNCLPGRVDFVAGAKTERRELVIEWGESEKWIADCPRDDLKFALFCGFHCGFRRGAIVHARPAWFSADLATVTVPGKEKQTLANGRRVVWRNKDFESCTIPLSKPFREFLKGFLDRKALFCLHPDRCSSPYRWDFRRPFENYVKERGRPECTIHAMRHSWLTILCNSGNHTITEIAAWSGDSIEVIEKHYWKKRAVPGALDDTLAGKRSGDALKEVIDALKTMNLKDLEPTEAEAVKAFLRKADHFDPSVWTWTSAVSLRHAELYSVKESVESREIFQMLLGDEADQKISDFDWEVGSLSSIRERLSLLEEFGFVSRVAA
jgi:integrase